MKKSKSFVLVTDHNMRRKFFLRRCNVFHFLVVAGLYLLWINYRNLGRKSMTDEYLYSAYQACVHPTLDPYHPSVLQLYNKVPPLDCSQDRNWIEVMNGTFWITDKAKRKHGNIRCKYAPVIRPRYDDSKTENGQVYTMSKSIETAPSDFFKIICKSTRGRTYNNIHATVTLDKKAQENYENVNHKQNYGKSLGFMNVLMFGFDSVSRMSWIRNLPHARYYFQNVLQGIELEGYNIVGDGTPQNLLPILTGKTETELPEARRGQPDAQRVDGHPWIWKDFQNIGYVTQWVEDMAHIGTFNLRMTGFKKQPVFHYMRPFYLEAEKIYRFNKPYCLGSQPRHQVMLHWLRDTFLQYKSIPKFIFGFHSEYSHGDSNNLQWADNDLKNFLQYLEEHGYLDNTLLILMSDHGARFHGIRETVQGKLEERMPYVALRVPPWFRKTYPQLYKQLQINAKRLTTPFDIYETFLDIIDKSRLNAPRRGRGISLFSKIPLDRSCENAGIEPHWCACLQWNDVDQKSIFITNIVAKVVDFINALTDEYRQYCHVLEMYQITMAQTYYINQKVLKFVESADNDGRVAAFNDTYFDKRDTVEQLVQVSFITRPGNGSFEVTVKYRGDTEMVTVSDKQISRINRYGHDADCVVENAPHLRQYCYCKLKK